MKMESKKIAARPNATVNVSPAQIAQNTWEMANSIEGILSLQMKAKRLSCVPHFNHHITLIFNNKKTNEIGPKTKRDQRHRRVR